MAVSNISKISIIGLERDRTEVLSFLQSSGRLELIPEAKISAEAQTLSDFSGVDPVELEDAITFLSAYPVKTGGAASLLKQRLLVSAKQLRDTAGTFDYPSFLEELNKLRSMHQEYLHRKERLSQERSSLMPWRGMDILLDDLHSTSQNCGFFLGTCSLKEHADLRKEMESSQLPLFINTVGCDKSTVYLAVIYLSRDFEPLETLLKNNGFNFVTLGRGNKTVREQLLEVNIEALILDDKIADIRERFSRMSEQQLRLMIVHDYLSNLKSRASVAEQLLRQKYTFVLQAWIRRKDEQAIKRGLFLKFGAIEVITSLPCAGEDVPTALENKPLVQPFEIVTNLYGQPVYRGIDPSGLLAPFFALSFGFCMADAGYGVILLAMAIYMFTRKSATLMDKAFPRLVFILGIVTVAGGIVTGGFFGDLISRLPDFFAPLKQLQRRMTVFDPVKDSMLFLGMTLIFGFIQVCTGVAIKFLHDLRQDKFSALTLDLPSLFVQFGMLMLTLVFTGIAPAGIMKYALVMLSVAGGLVIFYHWQVNKDISLKIFWSLFGLYSVITGNFLADTLSFSRIFALGLTGSLLGTAINTMLFPSGPVNGILGAAAAALALAVLFAGHILNMAIALLGAYVHTSRLQYLEFFGKFFESGGRPFKSFREEVKYTYITANN